METATLENSLSCWIDVPLFDREEDAQRWARSSAERLHDVRAAIVVEQVAPLLLGIASLPRPDEDTWRFVFLPDPPLPPSIWHLTLFPGDDRVTDEDLVRADLQGQVGTEIAGFELNGRTGLRSLRVGIDPTVSGEEALHSRASVVVRREIGSSGPFRVLAAATSAHLDAVALALEPMQYLLTSPHLADALGAGS